METPPLEPGKSTFVLRFWSEWVGDRRQWRGRIEHIQGGEHCAFARLSELLGFIARFVPLEQGQAAEDSW